MALPTEYQRALVAAIAELQQRPEFKVQAALARAIDYSPAALNRVNEVDGGSMEMLRRLARLLGKKSAEELVKEYEGTDVRLRDIPGFAAALAKARDLADYTEDVWIKVGNMFPMTNLPEVTPHVLIKAAEFVSAVRAPPSKKRPR